MNMPTNFEIKDLLLPDTFSRLPAEGPRRGCIEAESGAKTGFDMLRTQPAFFAG